MRRLTNLALILILAALGLAGPAAAVPGKGAKADTLELQCDGTAVTVVTSFPFHAFGAAHTLPGNKPGPLVAFEYEIFDGGQLVDGGFIGHSTPQRGQPVETCTGTILLAPDLVMNFEVTAFFPAGK